MADKRAELYTSPGGKLSDRILSLGCWLTGPALSGVETDDADGVAILGVKQIPNYGLKVGVAGLSLAPRHATRPPKSSSTR